MGYEEEWITTLINGIHYDRIPVKKKECASCEVRQGKLHRYGCESEQSPCLVHSKLILCDCDIRPGELV